MKNLKFFALMRTLEKEEVAHFQKYLKHFHGGEDIALQAFKYARTNYKKDEKKLDIAYAYQKIFGEEITENTRKKLLNTLSDLYLWLKDFLLSEKMRQDAFESQAIWLGILQEKGLVAPFSRLATSTYAETIGSPIKNTDDCWKGLLASYFYYQHLSLTKPAPDINDLQNCLDTIARCAETIRLKMAVEIANLKKIRPTQTPTTLSEASKISQDEDPPLLLMYRKLNQLEAPGRESSFFQLQAMLVEHASAIEPVELHWIFKYLYNYAATEIRNGHEDFFGKALHQLNIFGLERGFFIKKGVMVATEFVNIINVAARAKDYVWTDSFMKEQSQFISDDTRADAVLLANAVILFEKQDYKQALNLLEPTEFNDPHLFIRAKSLAVRCYFELKENTSSILEHCLTFERWLIRKRKPQTGAVEAALTFIRICKFLSAGKIDKQKLIDQIEEAPHVYFKEWLLAQAKNYKAKHAARKRKK